MPTDSNPILEICSVTKTFGEKVALDDVSWSIEEGCISGLLGPNGAGKTTLFRLLMGILQATDGSLRVAGYDAFEERFRLKRVIGFLPDEPIFYSYLTGAEILTLSAGMHELDPKKTIEELMPLIDRLNLSDALDHYADDYSRGMKKKLGLLLSLLHNPQLLILDEPTNGLDVESTRLFFEILREKSEAGTSIVFSTHLLDQVERICETVAIISEGKLVRSGDLASISGDRSLEDVFVELTSANPT